MKTRSSRSDQPQFSPELMLAMAKLLELLNNSNEMAALTASLLVTKDVLLTQEEAAAFLRRSPRTLEGDRTRGGGPIFVRLDDDEDSGGTKQKKAGVRYLMSDLRSWGTSSRDVLSATWRADLPRTPLRMRRLTPAQGRKSGPRRKVNDGSMEAATRNCVFVPSDEKVCTRPQGSPNDLWSVHSHVSSCP